MTNWKDSDHHPSLQGLEICVPNISPACRAKAKSCRLGLPGPCPGLGPPAGRPRYTFLLSSFAVSGRLTGWLRGCWERGTATTATIICLGSFAGGLGGLAGRICLAAAADSRWSCWRRMIFGRMHCSVAVSGTTWLPVSARVLLCLTFNGSTSSNRIKSTGRHGKSHVW